MQLCRAPGPLQLFASLRFPPPEAEADGHTEVGAEGVDEDGPADILGADDVIANVAVQDDKDCLEEAHHQQLQGVHLADDDTEADEDGGGKDTALDNVDEAELDDELIVEPGEADEDDGELCDDHGDDHGEAEGREAVALEEGHEVAEAGEEHEENIDAQMEGGQVGPGQKAQKQEQGRFPTTAGYASQLHLQLQVGNIRIRTQSVANHLEVSWKSQNKQGTLQECTPLHDYKAIPYGRPLHEW